MLMPDVDVVCERRTVIADLDDEFHHVVVMPNPGEGNPCCHVV